MKTVSERVIEHLLDEINELKNENEEMRQSFLKIYQSIEDEENDFVDNTSRERRQYVKHARKVKRI